MSRQVLRSTRLKDPEIEQELKHVLDQIVHKEDTVTKTTSKDRYKISNANIIIFCQPLMGPICFSIS